MMDLMTRRVDRGIELDESTAFDRFHMEASLLSPTVEQACRYLHGLAQKDHEGDLYVKGFYTSLGRHWPSCSPQALVKEMIRLEYASLRPVGQGLQAMCRLYLLTDPPTGAPMRPSVRTVTHIKPVERRVSHGPLAICVTDLEYRLFRLIHRAANPQPMYSWNAHILDVNEMYTAGTLVEQLRIPVALIKDVLTRFVGAGVLSYRKEAGIYRLAMNPENVITRKIPGRPVYLVSQVTFDRIQRADELARRTTTPEGTITNLTAYTRALAEEWCQTPRAVQIRLTGNLRSKRSTHSPFQSLVYTPEGVYPTPSTLSWCDLLVTDERRGIHSLKLTARDRGFAHAYQQVTARYAAALV